MKKPAPFLEKWYSGNVEVAWSRYHSDVGKDFFIVTQENGSFHTITSTQEMMQEKYPPNKSITRRMRR